MICLRHGAIASNEEHGWALCSRCFTEALAAAKDQALEDRIAALRLRTNTLELMRRLGW